MVSTLTLCLTPAVVILAAAAAALAIALACYLPPRSMRRFSVTLGAAVEIFRALRNLTGL